MVQGWSGKRLTAEKSSLVITAFANRVAATVSVLNTIRRFTTYAVISDTLCNDGKTFGRKVPT